MTQPHSLGEIIRGLEESEEMAITHALNYLRGLQDQQRANATFHTFKPSGKWKYSGRGHCPSRVFESHTQEAKIEAILAENDGCWPGMSSAATDLTLVVIPDEECLHGWPQMYVRPPWKD